MLSPSAERVVRLRQIVVSMAMRLQTLRRRRLPLTRRAFVELGMFAVMAFLLCGIAVLANDGANRRSLRVDVLTARRAEPGEVLPITVSARDDRGAPGRVVVDLGDGHREVVNTAEVPCASTAPRSQSFDLRHAFEQSGVYTVRATVTSAGCGPPERKTALWTITVKPPRQ